MIRGAPGQDHRPSGPGEKVPWLVTFLDLRARVAGSNSIRFARLKPRTLTPFNSGSSAHKGSLKTQYESMFKNQSDPLSGPVAQTVSLRSWLAALRRGKRTHQQASKKSISLNV
jgi:hypothetical protein